MKRNTRYRARSITILFATYLCFQFILMSYAAELRDCVAELQVQNSVTNEENLSSTSDSICPMAVGVTNETEENNTVATADRTHDDRLNYGKIGYSGDEDWWYIVFNQSGRANFWLGDIPSGCNYNLELYAANGITRYAVSSNSRNIAELIQFDVVANVRYNVRIYSQSGYSATGRYCLRIKNYPTIPSDAIGVYVTDSEGQPISNAVVYVYPQKYQTTMYPYDPVYTNIYGFAYKQNLSTGNTYAINVIANDYAAKAYSQYVTPSSSYVTIVLEDRSTTSFNAPINGFSAIGKWRHNSPLAHVDACDSCLSFERICPHTYMNVKIPQNFGWRYGVDSRIEFHQAVDISATSNENVYNIFDDTADVTESRFVSDCGEVVQLQCGDLFATYMHLNNRSVSKGQTVSGGEKIGGAGKTETFAVHVHLSISTDSKLWVDRRTDSNNSNVLLWDAEQAAKFLDPLRYID